MRLSDPRTIMDFPKSNYCQLFTLALFCLLFTGCQSHKAIAHLMNGYIEVTHRTPALTVEPAVPRVSFEHQLSGDKSTLIWPSMYGVNEVVQGDLAIFVGDKTYLESGAKVTHPRLFSVKYPELPVDITDEVLRLWSESAGKNLVMTLSKFRLVTPEETDRRLALHLDFYSNDKNWPDRSDLPLSWSQVSEIMTVVKQRGIVKKELQWHTLYLDENF